MLYQYKKFSVFAGFFMSGLLAASLAFAMPGTAGGDESRGFAAMDADTDGNVTREEFFDRHKDMKEAAFNAIDTDKNGVISQDEWDAFAGTHSKNNNEAHGGMAPSQKTPGQHDGMPDLIPPKK